MARDREEELKRLQESLEAPVSVYNNDSVDVDPDDYDLDTAEPPRKSSCLGFLIVVLLVAIAGFLYLAWGGKLPW